jgi:hypothetical protein
MPIERFQTLTAIRLTFGSRYVSLKTRTAPIRRIRDKISRKPKKHAGYPTEFNDNLSFEASRRSGADCCVPSGSAIRNKDQKLRCRMWAEKSGTGQQRMGNREK